MDVTYIGCLFSTKYHNVRLREIFLDEDQLRHVVLENQSTLADLFVLNMGEITAPYLVVAVHNKRQFARCHSPVQGLIMLSLPVL